MPAAQMRSDRLGGGGDEREVRLAILRQRRRHAHDHVVAGGHLGVVDGGAQEAGFDEPREHLRADVLDVRVAGVQARHAGSVRLHTEHGVAGLREGDGQRQSDVARSDHCNARIHDGAA